MPFSLFPILCVNAVKQPLRNRIKNVENIYKIRVLSHISLVSYIYIIMLFNLFLI